MGRLSTLVVAAAVPATPVGCERLPPLLARTVDLLVTRRRVIRLRRRRGVVGLGLPSIAHGIETCLDV
eukprot:COSAG01_NODE_4214_length_5232_cov_2.808689_5_plen_68_part_00